VSRRSRQVRAQVAALQARAEQRDAEAAALTQAAAETDDPDVRATYLGLADIDDVCASSARRAAASGEHLADLLDTPIWRRR
jgi:hypothetical protein